MKKTYEETLFILSNRTFIEDVWHRLKKEYDVEEGDKIYEVFIRGGYCPIKVSSKNARGVLAFFDSIYFKNEADAEKQSDRRLGDYGDFLRG